MSIRVKNRFNRSTQKIAISNDIASEPEPAIEIRRPSRTKKVSEPEPEPAIEIRRPSRTKKVSEPEPEPAIEIRRPSRTKKVSEPEPVTEIRRPSRTKKVSEPEPEPAIEIRRPSRTKKVSEPEPVTEIRRPSRSRSEKNDVSIDTYLSLGVELGVKPNIDRVWYKSLKIFLRDLLRKYAIPRNQSESDTKSEMEKWISKEAMQIWVKAFTSSSFYSVEDSYEQLEFIGDKILKSVFVVHVLNLYPDLDEEKLTEIDRKYMSAPKQSEYAEQLGLNLHIRVSQDLQRDEMKFGGDLYEGFIGALYSVANLIDKENSPSAGNEKVLLFIRNQLGDSIEVSGLQENKTLVVQMFNRFNFKGEKLGDPIEDYNKISGVMTIVLTHGQIGFLKQHKKFLKSNVIGVGESRIKSEAHKIAYEDALKNLAKIGVTPDWSKELKRLAKFSHPRIERLYRAIVLALKKRSIIDLNIIKLKEEKVFSIEGSYFLQVRAKDTEKNKHLILVTKSILYEEPLIDAYHDILRLLAKKLGIVDE
jgi:dsRNA-specific ribonuclease